MIYGSIDSGHWGRVQSLLSSSNDSAIKFLNQLLGFMWLISYKSFVVAHVCMQGKNIYIYVYMCV